MGLSRGEAKIFEIGQSFGPLGEFLVLAADGSHRFDLGHRDPQFVGLERSPVAFGDENVEFALVGLPATVGLLVVAEKTRQLGAGETIEGLPLCCRGTEPHLVGLAVDDDELLPYFVEHPDRCGAPADDGATAAVLRDRSAEDELVTLHLAAGIAHPLGDGAARIDLPATLDDDGTAALTQNRAVGSLAQQEAERCDHHGLARTGLPGDRGEARPEGQRRLTDHPEVADGDFFDHATTPSSLLVGPRQPLVGRSNLPTRRSVNGPW